MEKGITKTRVACEGTVTDRKVNRQANLVQTYLGPGESDKMVAEGELVSGTSIRAR